jgi:hypothetical protein
MMGSDPSGTCARTMAAVRAAPVIRASQHKAARGTKATRGYIPSRPFPFDGGRLEGGCSCCLSRAFQTRAGPDAGRETSAVAQGHCLRRVHDHEDRAEARSTAPRCTRHGATDSDHIARVAVSPVSHLHISRFTASPQGGSMKRCIVYRGVFGCWGWEVIDERGRVLAESTEVFEDREDCVDDARRRGYAVSPTRRSSLAGNSASEPKEAAI